MTGALLGKELRQLAPVAVLMLLASLSNLVYLPMVLRLDELTWSETGAVSPGDGVGTAAMLIILSLVTGYSLFCREHDEGTIDFLGSLPVTRRAVYSAKVAAGAIVLCGGFWLGMASDCLLMLLADQTHGADQLPRSTLLRLAFVYGCVCLIGLGHAIVASFFRRFGLLLYGIAWWAVQAAGQVDGSLSVLNPLLLAKIEYRGYELVVPWRALGGHLAVAGLAYLAGFVLWMGAGASWSAGYQRIASKGLGRALLVVTTAAILGVCWKLLAGLGGWFSAVVDESARYEPFTVSRATTEHYRFAYPSALAATARALVADSDDAYRAVVADLGAGPTPPIVVDMTDRSVEHAGIAGWQKIRMDIRGHWQLDHHRHVFHHESAHVVVAHEAGLALTRSHDSTRFFGEGVAEYVALRAVPRPEVLDEHRLAGALSWQRHGIDFDDLIDSAELAARFDDELVYTVGELWVQGLADACGDRAPGAVVRAIGREGRPTGLAGQALWRDALQAAGCELESVDDAWRRRMREVLSAQEERARAVPVLSGGVARVENAHVVLAIVPDRALGDPGRVRVRVRGAWLGGQWQIRELRPHDGGAVGDGPVEVRVPLDLVDADGFWFQAGYLLRAGTLVHYEPWQRAEH